jgi:hypothetical protein
MHARVFDLVAVVDSTGIEVVTAAWRSRLAGTLMTGFVAVAEQLVRAGGAVWNGWILAQTAGRA